MLTEIVLTITISTEINYTIHLVVHTLCKDFSQFC